MNLAYARQCITLLIIGVVVITTAGNLHAQSFTPPIALMNLPDSLQTTSLEFGPDEKLYVLDLKGDIYIFSILRYIDGITPKYEVINTEHISLVRNIQNHNDDGTPHSEILRQATGITIAGTASDPIIYVTSSDHRINDFAELDSGLDTNSGTVSRLTKNGDIWEMVHLVRGLPRSEENHATNGLHLDTDNNILYVAQGGNSNGGGPAFLFGYLTEYALSCAILAIDLNAIDTMPVNIDTMSGEAYIYDLPTVDDPTRDNANGINDPMTPGYDGMDLHDPFGGNDGLNQAKWIEGGPVQVHSGGYRNPYDVIMMSDGHLYTWDNGGNSNWGGKPANTGYGTATNELTSDFGMYMNNRDRLHRIDSMGYFAGHSNPIRANPDSAGLFTAGDANVFRTSYDPENPDISLPFDWPPVDAILASPQEGEFFQGGDSADASLYYHTESTNGLAEYGATNFDSAMTGDLIAAGYGNRIYRVHFDSARNVDTISILTNIGGALDITCKNDDEAFPGTIWVGVLTNGIAGIINILEPTEPFECSGNYFVAVDEDLDGYTNADEIDTGSDPCLGSLRPSDFDSTLIDGFLVSDLNDPDDDDDGLADSLDAFAWDATNGTATFMPVDYHLFNNDPGTGFYGLGFTGLMTNGSTDYLDAWKQEDNSDVEIIAGGATGVISLIGVDSGDARGTLNDQSNAFQFGVAVDSLDEPFVVKVDAIGPLFLDSIENYQSIGAYIGTGDQDNYLKISGIANDSNPAIEVLLEVGGSVTADTFDVVGLNSASTVGFVFVVNPANGYVYPYYTLDAADPVALGTGIGVTGLLLETIKGPDALAVGIIATARGSESRFDATWDRIQVKPDPVSFGIEMSGDWVVQSAGSGCSPDGTTGNCCTPTHECGFVQSGDRFYLIGGRELDHVEIYDPVEDIWTIGADLPFDSLHHFQALDYNGLIIIAGAFEGPLSNENNVDTIFVYDPVIDSILKGPAIPAERARGSAAAAIHDDKLFLVGGNNMGHNNGSRAWVDVYDFKTNTWDTLPDAPHKRDHFHAAVIGNKLYAAAGRRTGFGTTPGTTEPTVDILNLTTGEWDTLDAQIPTERAGAATVAFGNDIIVMGGETSTEALKVTEALNTQSETWRTLEPMNNTRHGAQAIVNNNAIFIAAGAIFPGGTAFFGFSEWYYPYGETEPVAIPLTQSTLSAADSLAFPNTLMYNTSVIEVSILNTSGDQAILVSELALVEGSAFSVTDTVGFPRFIKPGDSIAVQLLFHPEYLLSYSDTLRVGHTGTNAPTTDIVIKGDADLTWIGGSRIYVDSAFAGQQYGTAWDSAVTSLKVALNTAMTNPTITEVWVAKGTYLPGIERSDAFVLSDSVHVYGGFEGNESFLNERNTTANQVILSGDIGIAGDSTDNTYHVVVIPQAVDTSLLDGVVIHGGIANGTDMENQAGGGIYNLGNAVVSNSTIRHCASMMSGSAILSKGMGSLLRLQNVYLIGNTETYLSNENGGEVRISGFVSGTY